MATAEQGIRSKHMHMHMPSLPISYSWQRSGEAALLACLLLQHHGAAGRGLMLCKCIYMLMRGMVVDIWEERAF
jgi:hypothetical protein